MQKSFLGILSIVVFLAFFSCKNEISIEDIQIENENALRVSISFQSQSKASAQVEFWNLKDSVIRYSKKYGLATLHKISLLPLKAQSDYGFRVYLNNEDQNYVSETYTFQTKPLPASLPHFTFPVYQEKIFSGFILVKKVQSPGQQIIIDNSGKIVWYQEFDTTLFRPFSWTANEHILSMNSEKEFYEIDLDGTIQISLQKGQKDFNQDIHHEIIKDKSNNYVMLTRNNKVMDLSKLGGIKNDTIKSDGILVLDSVGNKIWDWDMFDFVDPLKDDEILKTKGDWSHANALAIDTDGNYLVSFRHFNQIWKIDSENGAIMWKLGESGDFALEPNAIFYLQHAAHINSRGELMLFDNGGPKRKSSRALSFDLDLDQMKAKVKLNVSLPDSLFSFKQGSAYLIENDKILFCSSIKKSIVVTDLFGEILWQLNSDYSFYRAEYMDKIHDLEF